MIKKSYFGVEENRAEKCFLHDWPSTDIWTSKISCATTKNYNKIDLPYRNTVTFWIFSDWSLLTKLPVIYFLTDSCLSSFFPIIFPSLDLCLSHPPHSQPLRGEWRGVGDKVSRIFRIWSGLGIGGHRVYTCQQRCQPSSACRKYDMIGAWPNIGMFSHRGCCLGRMSRRLLMTLVCCQLCLRELKNGFIRWSIRTKMEDAEKRIEVKRSVDLPSPAAISILQFHTGKKKIW